VLRLSGHDAPGLVENCLLAPPGVDQVQRVRNPVVLSHEHGVHHRQTRLFTCSSVTCKNDAN